MTEDASARGGALRVVVRRVAVLNLGYFAVEMAVAAWIGSVALFADSVDFLEDAAVNLLVLLALGWSAHKRAALGGGLGALLLVPSLATLVTAWEKVSDPVAPSPLPLGLAGLGALIVNSMCALMLARHRSTSGSLTRAAFLSARNDAVANLAIILAGIITAATLSPWPDLIVGLGIFLMNAGAAVEIWRAAREEWHATP